MNSPMPLPSLFLALAILACSKADGISADITKQFDASSSAPVNLAIVGPASWTRVCVLGPYSDNKSAERVLGFKWDLAQHSSIGHNDGINFLVFIRGQEVVAFAEHRRDKGDFLKLSPRCLERLKATLVRQVGVDGWVQLALE